MNTNVVLVSSLFGQPKIAEPLGICFLAASLRAAGVTCQIIEPSVAGLSLSETVEHVVAQAPRIIGVSVLRDKHTRDLLEFTFQLRDRLPNSYICIGGHGPTISVTNIPEGQPIRFPLSSEDTAFLSKFSSSDQGHSLESVSKEQSCIDVSGSGRGLGPGTTFGPDEPKTDNTDVRESPYFDKTDDYLRLLRVINAFLLGEAEETFTQLVKRILNDQDWRDIPGIAYADDAGCLRRVPPIEKTPNLDHLPLMVRDVYKSYLERYGKILPASLIASRGCLYRCTFCSVVQFERTQRGSRHRFRSVDNVLSEMMLLHEEYRTTHFNFEDDNLINGTENGRKWLFDLCSKLERLPYRLTFTIFCRPDAVRADLFSALRNAGLTGVYFGVESICDDHLKFFSKDSTVAEIWHALDVFDSLGFSAAVGSPLRLMLGYITWHPLTTAKSLRAASQFVRQVSATPKLLRRRLRLYPHTAMVSTVRAMGLLSYNRPNGWTYKQSSFEGADDVVDQIFSPVNGVRDRLRTIEKAALEYKYDLEASVLNQVSEARRSLDSALLDAFDNVVEVLSTDCDLQMTHLDVIRDLKLGEEILNRSQALRICEDVYSHLKLPIAATDLFRK